MQRLLPERGYGFIRGHQGAWDGVDFFFHFSSLRGCRMEDLTQGVTLVCFEPRRVARGPRAEEIELVTP